MLPYKRSQRVSDLIREEMADIIMNKLKDPRMGFVTVTGVNLTEDMKHAKVFVSFLKKQDEELFLKILNTAKGFIRAELSRRVRMRFVPELSFRVDEAIDYGNKIEMLLKEIKEKH